MKNPERIRTTLLITLQTIALLSSEGLAQDKETAIDPRKAAARATLLSYEGRKLMSDRKYAAACQKFEEALKIQTNNKELKKEYAYCLDLFGVELYKAKKYKEAIEKLKKALKISPDNAEFQNHLSRFNQALRMQEQNQQPNK